MTMPDERFAAVEYARQFLLALVDSKQTPKVPRYIRQEALRRLRHYPQAYELELAAEKAPAVFQSREIDDLSDKYPFIKKETTT